MIVQFRKWELRLQSQDNSFKAKDMSFILFIYFSLHLPLSSSSFQLRHHRIVTYGKQKYSFVPHSPAILHFCASGIFCPFESSSCLSFWIFIQAPLSIVSFCVRDAFNFQLTDGEEIWKFVLKWFSTLFRYLFLS